MHIDGTHMKIWYQWGPPSTNTDNEYIPIANDFDALFQSVVRQRFGVQLAHGNLAGAKSRWRWVETSLLDFAGHEFGPRYLRDARDEVSLGRRAAVSRRIRVRINNTTTIVIVVVTLYVLGIWTSCSTPWRWRAMWSDCMNSDVNASGAQRLLIGRGPWTMICCYRRELRSGKKK